MIILLVLLVIQILTLFFDLNFLAVSDTSPWWTLFTYNFLHVSFLHLGINSFVYYSYYKVLTKEDLKPIVILSLLITPIAAYFSAEDIPTCGFSAVISVMMGYYLNKASPKFFVKAMLLVIFSYIFTFTLSKGVNTLIHAYCFFPSLILTFIYRRIKK